MKTLTLILLSGILSINHPFNATADGDPHNKTSYTSPFFFNASTDDLQNSFSGMLKPDEEPFVNDIPFSTSGITADYFRNLKLKSIEIPEMSPEFYIDDIPFNTENIATLYRLKASDVSGILNLKDESPAPDFPFNTAIIAGSAASGKLPLVLQPEQYADDIPFDTEEISKQSLQREKITVNRGITASGLTDTPDRFPYEGSLYRFDADK